MRRIPVDGLGDEGRVGYPEGDAKRIQWRQHGAAGMGVGLFAGARRWRSLVFRQPVDVVVEQQNRDVHVVPDGVNPVRGTDGAAIAVAGDHEDVEIGAASADSARHGKGASVEAVEAVGAHVMWEAAGATDTRYTDCFLR